MSKVEILEAIDCCATSSVMVNGEAIEWNTSTEWVKENGVDIQHYSLARSPQQSLNMPVTEKFLDTSRVESLPVILLDGRLVMTDKLSTRESIAR